MDRARRYFRAGMYSDAQREANETGLRRYLDQEAEFHEQEQIRFGKSPETPGKISFRKKEEMMAAKKFELAEPVVMTTPVGELLYPWLIVPDTAFGRTGDKSRYETKIILPPSKELDKICAVIKETRTKALEKAREAYPEEGVGPGPAPVEREEDAKGKPTGNLILSTHMNAQGEKDGKKWTMRPALFDARGREIDPSAINPWSGTKARLNIRIVDYYMPSNNYAGASIQLSAVQIIKLVSGRAAGDFGFEEIEDGYDSMSSDGGGFEEAPPRTEEEIKTGAANAGSAPDEDDTPF